MNWLRLLISLAFLIAVVLIVRLLAPGAATEGMTLHDGLGRAFDAPPAGLSGAATALGFLLVGAWLAGKLFSLMHLPRITGYLLFGVLVGPELAKLLPETWPTLVTEEQMQHLRLVDSLAISLIAMTAGAEIRVDVLRRDLRRVLLITAFSVVLTLVGVSGGLLAVNQAMELPGDGTFRVTAVICLLIGAIAIANSPAALIAVIDETRADGPMTQMSLIVTVFRDLCLVIAFTILLTISVNLLADDAASLASRSTAKVLTEMAWHLLGSIAVGTFIGVLMRYAITRIGKQMVVFIVAIGLSIALVSDVLHLESLLVALTAGFVLANVWPERSSPLFHAVERVSLPVYCVFFASAGTMIHLDAIARLWPLALVIVVIRAAMVYSGTWIGATLGGMRGVQRRWLGACFLAQAGVSIALATTVASTFGEYEWAAEVASLILAAVAIHELVGPVLMRIALVRAGEARVH